MSETKTAAITVVALIVGLVVGLFIPFGQVAPAATIAKTETITETTTTPTTITEIMTETKTNAVRSIVTGYITRTATITEGPDEGEYLGRMQQVGAHLDDMLGHLQKAGQYMHIDLAKYCGEITSANYECLNEAWIDLAMAVPPPEYELHHYYMTMALNWDQQALDMYWCWGYTNFELSFFFENGNNCMDKANEFLEKARAAFP